MSQESIIIVIGYPHQWHWVLSAEYALSDKSECVRIFDCSNMGLLAFQQPNFPFSRNWLFRRQIIRKFKANNTWFKSVKFDYLDQINALIYAIFRKYPEILDGKQDEFKSIYPSIVNACDDTRIFTRSHKFQLILEQAKSKLMELRLSRLHLEGCRSLVTVNGRFTNNYVVRTFANNHGVSTSFLEFGSNKESYEQYFVSPHSFSELREKMMLLWEGTSEQIEVAHDFFAELTGYDRNAGVSWTRNMTPGLVPATNPGQKICVFYTSSQKEFVGVGDEPDPSGFENQFDAFESLYSELVNQDWVFFIRRHPKLNPSSKDPDGYYWDKYKNLKNVRVIEPTSNIDSYALGEKADLVAHFNSSVGIQLIYTGHRSVITLGTPMWAELVPGTSARNLEEIREFLQTPTKNWSRDSVLPWAYFRATFGQKFHYFDFVASKTTWKFKK